MSWFENNIGLRFWDVVDIGVVALLIYWIMRLIRGTRAVYMLVGLTVAILVYWVSSFGKLYTLNWLLSNLFESLLLIVVVVFQSDIRRVLTQVGRTPIFSILSFPQNLEVIEELVKASVSLANKKIGAIIVLERDANVLDYMEVGIPLDSVVTKELLTSIFLPSSPIHDGAVIVQKGRLTAAGCFLPLTMSSRFGNDLGTRHRAAIGITEETDAAVIVVSEEKGWISLASEGNITRGIDGPALRKLLIGYLQPQARPFRQFWKTFFKPKREST